MNTRKLTTNCDHQVSDLKEMHYRLNKMYHNMLFGADVLIAENLLEQDIKILEKKWIALEQQECIQSYDCYQTIVDEKIVEKALKTHPVYQHPLFYYLKNTADMYDLKTFLLHESVLNLEFFDYLALALVGASDQAKSEIIQNLWDEAGHGNIQKFHTTMFKKLITDLGLQYDRQHIIANMSWEALAGINLFNYFSFYPQHKMKYFGLLAATEMLDPPHYCQLISGIKRIIQHLTVDQTYYLEHVEVDVKHANGWLNKVILPELMTYPEKTHEFWVGFYMRLNSTERYYNYLMSLFSAKLAA